MITGRINSYKGFETSKKIYLQRKKDLNREIKKVKKRRNIFKHKIGKKYLSMVIKRGESDLEILRIMYNLKKRESKFNLKHKHRRKI